MTKTKIVGKLHLERETIRTLYSDTLAGVAGGMAVPRSFLCPPAPGGQVGGPLSDIPKPVPAPEPVPGGKFTDVLTGPRLGTCFCPPRGQ